jgi:hypothetical protein
LILHKKLDYSKLRSAITTRQITLGGNIKLKIYGTLTCTSGKRMKKENRVFFKSQTEAVEQGYRPCAHCMKPAYQKWKNGSL